MAWLDILHDQYHRHRPNILIVGPEFAVESALRGLGPLFAGPTETCVLPGPLRLPRPGCAAFILRNVGALNPEQQEQLSRWLESGSRVPVVSLSSAPVFALVVDGRFNERLYYKLNMIFEEAGSTSGVPN